MWLGRLWASPSHLVYDLADKCIREVRAVLRVPLPERWDREALQSVDAWPRRLEPAPEAGEAQVVPGPIPAADVPPPEAPPPPARRDPYPLYIQKGDLARYGYSEGCVKCDRILHGQPVHGFRHSEACRRRIERELRDAGDRRVAAAERRMAERIVQEGGDPSAPAPAEEPGQPLPAARVPAAEGPAGQEEAMDDAAPGMPEPARLPQSMGPAAPADVPMDAGAPEGSMEVEGACWEPWPGWPAPCPPPT